MKLSLDQTQPILDGPTSHAILDGDELEAGLPDC